MTKSDLEFMKRVGVMKDRKPVNKVRPKPRRGPMRHAGYRMHLRITGMCVVGDLTGDCAGVIDPAHTQNNGLSSKGPDSSCAPLCRKHHREYDSGRTAFENKYDVDMKALAAAHYARFQRETA